MLLGSNALLGLALVLGLLGPEAEPKPEPEPEAEPEPAAQLPPGPETHGRVELEAQVRGRRDPVAGARLYAVDEAAAIEVNPERLGELDEDGKVALWLAPGNYTVELVADGFEPLRFELEVRVGEREVLELRVDEEVGGKRYRTEVSSERAGVLSRTRLRDEAIHELPGSGGDPFSAIRSLPGVAQVTGFLPYVVVRGAAPGNTGYYLDGVRVPLLFHVAAGPSVIHPYFVDSVDFYPSGAPVRLGRYASGIIEGRTRKPGRERVRGEVDLRLTDAGALVEIPFDRPRAPTEDCPDCRGPARGSLALAGRYSYTGLLLSAIPALNVKLRFWDYQARLDHDLGPRARYTAFVFGAYDELGQTRAQVLDDDGDVVIDEDPDPFVRLEFHRIDQRVDQRLRGGAQIRYGLTLGLDRSGVQDVRVNEWRVSPRLELRKTLVDNLELRAGLDQSLQFFRLPQGLSTSTTGASVEDLALFLAERTVSSTGLYADLRYSRGAVEVQPGVRVELWAQSGVSPYLPEARTRSSAVGLDPRLSVREAVSDRWTLRQTLAVHHQPPDPPLPIPGVEGVSLDAGLQRSVQASFGWTGRLGDRAELEQTLFGARLTNMQDYELGGDDGDPGGQSISELEDFLIRVSGWSWGLESRLSLVPTGKLYGWIAYTLSWSIRDFPLGGTAFATWDQRHILNAVAGWTFNRKWRVGGRLHVNTGRPYTSRQALPEGGLENLTEALRNHRNDARLPTFVQLDARVERIFTFRDFRLHLYLDLTNANLGREVLSCNTNAQPSEVVEVIDGCVNPQALRYVLPSLGLRAVF